MATEEARFSLKLEADGAPAAEAAAELEKFRAAIAKSEGALASYRKSLSLLKGNSDEVKSAKAQLKAAIDLEKSAVTKNNLGILKLGGSYDKLSKASRKNTEAQSHGRKAISAVGGPVKGLVEKFDSMKGLMPLLATGWGALAVGVALAVASIAIAAAAVGTLTAKFTEWLATTADANRNLQLTREAFSGNAKNATAWGHAIDWASEKTAITTAKLNELVVATEKSYRGSRISGQGMVDAFKASAAAAGAGREDVGSFFDELISRGKQTGRSFISFGDFAKFRNAGIDVNSVFKELGVSAAQGARGAVVSTDKMAEALRKVSESRFADINAKKMLSLGFQWDHLTDNFMRFTNDLAGEGGALEPLLKAISEVAKMFDLSTESGQDLKKSITDYGTVIASAIVAHIPDIKAFVSEVIKIGGAFIDAVAGVIKWSQSATGVFVLKVAFASILLVLAAVGVAVGAVVAGFAFVAAPIIAAGLAIVALWDAGKKLISMDWASIGHAIVDGIKNGLTAAWNALKGAVVAMGTGIKDTFKSILGIASPSKVFATYGEQSGEGYKQGIVASQPKVAGATAAMATSAASGASSSSGGSSGSKSVSIGKIENVFHISGANADEIKEAITSGSVLDALASSIKMALQASGIPVTVTSTSGGP